MSVLLFTVFVFLLYFLSRKSLNELYFVLKKIFKKNSFVYLLIAIIFFPGTVLHEFSHAIMARLLFLKVFEIKLTPEWSGNSLELGKVTYMKSDFIRGIIVGVAPVVGGILLFFYLEYAEIFPNPNMYMNVLIVYLIFVISTTMFSSKQDLIDGVYLIPILAVIGGVMYLFNYNIFEIIPKLSETHLWTFLNVYFFSMNIMILIILAVHIFLIVFLKLFRRIIT